LIAAIIIANLILSFYPILRIDLTKDKIHSISAASQGIVKGLDDLVRIKVFMTKDLPPEIKPIATDLKTILDGLVRINRNKLQVEYFDPNKDEKAKSEAEKLGIRALQFSSIKSDKFEVQNGYFGLALIYGDKQEILPVAGDVGNLEYFVVSGIKKLTAKKIPAVAVAEEQVTPGSSEIQLLSKYLERDYQISEAVLDGESKLPEAETLLIVGRSKKIDDKGINKIKEWIKQKKGLIALIDKVNVDNSMAAKLNENTGLEDIFKQYGIEIEPKLVMDQSSGFASFRSQSGAFLTQYVYWPQIRPENINNSLPAMSGISSLMLAWASPMKLSGEAKAMFSSSERSVTDDSLTDLSPTTKRSTDQVAGKQVIGAINSQEAKLAVIADADFIKDQFVSNNQQNLAVVLNLVDYFSQDSSLLTIRSKNLRNNPLIPLSEGMKTAVKAINLGLPIIILVITVAISNLLRKRRNQKWYERN